VTFPSSQPPVPAVVGRLAGFGVERDCVWLRTGALPGLSAEFFAAYEVEPDPTRVGYYRRLWQAEDIASR
jgi:hypothetical protein